MKSCEAVSSLQHVAAFAELHCRELNIGTFLSKQWQMELGLMEVSKGNSDARCLFVAKKSFATPFEFSSAF
jgi:hypothetical protein